MEYNAIVLTSLRHLLKGLNLKYRGGIKSNLIRIAQKIEEDGSPYSVTDMIRATVYCNSIDQLWDVYKYLDQNPLGQEIQLIRIKPKLRSDLKNVTLNFVWYDSIIGEIQLRYGRVPFNYYSNHFIYELERADSIFQFQQQAFSYCNKIAEMGCLFS